jgi:hypothetical protein
VGAKRVTPAWSLAATALAATALATVTAGCGSAGSGIPAALIRQSRPIGHGAGFHPPATGPVIGGCRPGLGPRFGVHVEVFAANQVVLIAAGIGARPPLSFSAGRISGAGCYGALVTLEPTGVALLRPGARLTVSDLFRAWGQPLSQRRLVSFRSRGDERVAAYVDGRRWDGAPGGIPLERHSEIVLELGPHVPPHSSYDFPPGS